ncbi:MAG: glycerol-3-phosphate acyltransferase [Planctomycetaceae bacterium]
MLLVAILAYLSGSIPFAFLIGKYIGGIDIRTVGSGNVGATNIGRTMGSRWGIVVLVLDALKGLLPVAFLPPLFLSAEDSNFIHCKVIAAVGAILGHMCPIWLGFRGGKGVATALGGRWQFRPSLRWEPLLRFCSLLLGSELFPSLRSWG